MSEEQAAASDAPAADAAPAAAENTNTADTPADGGDGNKDLGNTDQKESQDQEQPNTDSDDISGDESPKADEADADDKKADGEEGNDEDAKAIEYKDFNLPEGMEVNTEALDEIKPILAKYGVPQEDAQSVVDIGAKLLSKTMKDAQDHHNGVVEGWRKDTLEKYGKDGDAAFEEKTATAQIAIEKLFSEQERGFITSWGVGNMPGFFAAMSQIGQAIKEDSSFNAGGSKPAGEETLADVWYPDTK